MYSLSLFTPPVHSTCGASVLAGVIHTWGRRSKKNRKAKTCLRADLVGLAMPRLELLLQLLPVLERVVEGQVLHAVAARRRDDSSNTRFLQRPR